MIHKKNEENEDQIFFYICKSEKKSSFKIVF